MGHNREFKPDAHILFLGVGQGQTNMNVGIKTSGGGGGGGYGIKTQHGYGLGNKKSFKKAGEFANDLKMARRGCNRSSLQDA